MNALINADVNRELIAVSGADADDLSSGVGGGYAVLKFRASKWRLSYGGNEEPIINKTTGDTVPSLEVVLVKGSPVLAKSYYKSKYVEGSNEAPDCWSMDGKRPDSQVVHPVSNGCAACPMNAFGSRVSDTQSKGKACQDVRRVAVVPANDMRNEAMGGPMLLRVPPASLADLAKFSKDMKANGYPYNAIVTRLGFDPEASYPKLTFRAVRPLSAEQQAELVQLLQEPEFSEKVDRILDKMEDAEPVAAPVAAAAPAPAPVQAPAPAPAPVQASMFEEPVAPAPQAAPKPRGRPKATPALAAQPAASPFEQAPQVRTAPPAAIVSEEDDASPDDASVASILEGLGLSS